MHSELILALDQGTSSSRALVVDATGAVLGTGSNILNSTFPQSGWVEQNPEEIWRGQFEAATAALNAAGVTGKDIRAIGITNQRETSIIWDRNTGEPVAPAIVWQDRRTTDLVDSWRRHEAEIRSRTGLLPDAYFSASKIRWLLDSDPGLRQRAEAGELAFGTVDTWLLYRLTDGQVHATDVSNASRTMLFNISELAWDQKLLDLFDIPASLLPSVLPSIADYGSTSVFGGSVPIMAIAGDQHAATFGQACFEPGLMKCTYGTGCFLMQNAGTLRPEAPEGLLSTIGWQLGVSDAPVYALEGSVFVGGSVVRWLRDSLGLISSSDEIEALALSVPDSDGVMFVPAFSGLGAPHWDQSARGTLVGMTYATTGAHIARAALEGIAYQVSDVAAQLTDTQEIRVDGGAASNSMLMQFQADITGRPVIRSAVAETTAMGAAYMAGLASGQWNSQAEVASLWKSERVFEPAIAEATRQALLDRWLQAVNRSKGWAINQAGA